MYASKMMALLAGVLCLFSAAHTAAAHGQPGGPMPMEKCTMHTVQLSSSPEQQQPCPVEWKKGQMPEKCKANMDSKCPVREGAPCQMHGRVEACDLKVNKGKAARASE